MSAPMTAAQWRTAMKKWDVKVEWLAGWENRGRNLVAGGSSRPFSNVNGIVIHHTGSDSQAKSYVDWLFKTGRPAEGIPGPLAQAMTMMDGRTIIGARGRSNHAGNGSATVLAKVVADTIPLTSEVKPGPSNTDGNARFYGNEVAFDGGQPMTAAQYAGVVRWCAAICDHHGWTGASIIGHGEWTSAKWDPGATDMAKLRRDVNALLKTDTKPTPKPEPVEPPAARQRRKIMTYNPSDKLGNTTARAKLVAEMALGGQIGVPDIIAFQELGGRKGEGIGSAWATLVDAALPANFRLFVPTTNFNENYTAINTDTTEHVKVLADHIIRVPGAAGKHCTRVITKDKATGRTLLVGNVHIDPYTSDTAQKAQALSAYQSLKDEYDKGGIDDFVLCGDFNDEVFYSSLTSRNQVDAGSLAAKKINWEFESFSGTSASRDKDRHIDYIVVHKNESVHAVEVVQLLDPSGKKLKSPKGGDHQPVLADVTFN